MFGTFKFCDSLFTVKLLAELELETLLSGQASNSIGLFFFSHVGLLVVTSKLVIN